MEADARGTTATSVCFCFCFCEPISFSSHLFLPSLLVVYFFLFSTPSLYSVYIPRQPLRQSGLLLLALHERLFTHNHPPTHPFPPAASQGQVLQETKGGGGEGGLFEQNGHVISIEERLHICPSAHISVLSKSKAFCLTAGIISTHTQIPLHSSEKKVRFEIPFFISPSTKHHPFIHPSLQSRRGTLEYPELDGPFCAGRSIGGG